MRCLARLLPLLLLVGCSSIDCPLNHTVLMKVCVDDGGYMTGDTVSIFAHRTDGTDTLLANRLVDDASAYLHLSYQGGTDHFVLLKKDTLNHITLDTLRVSQTSLPHFESVDCAPTYFHTLEQVTTTHHAIDSAVLSRTTVDYDTTRTHITIYYKVGN